MNAIDVAAMRVAVEGAAVAVTDFAEKLRSMQHMTQSAAIEKMVVAELQRQGADLGTANVAARHALDVYRVNSRMGNASLKAVLKAAGEFAERTQKGFKYRSR